MPAVHGWLQSVAGKRNGREYRLLVDSGSSINLIKEEYVPNDSKIFKMIKNFSMGNDKHQSDLATHINYLGKSHLFHIIPNNFPLPEEGIIGLPFLKQYNKYYLTDKWLYLDGRKMLLHDDGYFVESNVMRICCIPTEENDEDVWIENQQNIPDGLYKCKNNNIKLPSFNYKNKPIKQPEKICFDTVTNIASRDVIHSKSEREIPFNSKRIWKLKEKTRLDHVENDTRETIWKIITKYNTVFTVEGDSIPCTNPIPGIYSLCSFKMTSENINTYLENDVDLEKNYSINISSLT